MHYLKDGPFRGHVETDETGSIGDVLANLAGMYQPIRELTLKTAEIRKLNKAIDVLEAGSENGHFALEDEDFKVLKRVVVTLAENSSMARSAPIIEDILNDAVTERPVLPGAEGVAVGLREVTGD